MANKYLIITLKSIDYTGDNLGDDIHADLTIAGQTVTYDRQLKNGTKLTLREVMIEKEITTDIHIPINIQVVEKDPLYNDTGSHSEGFQIICNGAEIQTHVSRVTVPGDSLGDRKKKAVFIFEFEATLKTTGIRYVKNVSNRGWLSIKHEDTLTSPNVLPFASKVQVTKVANGREYFIIEEGYLIKGHIASIKLSDNGTSYLTEENLHTAPVHLIYSKQNEILQIAGTKKEYWAVLDPDNPLPNGIYDIEIPYEPHHRYGEYYEKYSIYAKTWFRIGHSGDRFLHFGNVSEGCLTVKVQETHKDRWNEIYNLLITSRKGDSLSVGIVEIVD